MQPLTSLAPSPRAVARLVLLLSAGHLLAFVDRAKVAGAMPAIRRQVAMSDTAAGWVIGTGIALGYGATILALALLSPTRRWRSPDAAWSWRLPGGIAVWTVAGLGTAFAASAPALVATRVLAGVGQALFIPAAVSWIVSESDRIDSRAIGLSRFTAAASLGRSVGLLMIGVALAAMLWAGRDSGDAWRWSFVLLALPNLMLLALVVRRRPAGLSGGAGAASPAPAPVANRHTRAAYLVLALLPVVVVQALAGWLPTLLVQARGLTTQGAATWLGVLTLIGGAGSQIVAGWLLQRQATWRRAAPLVIVGSMAAALPGVLLLGWGTGPIAATLGVLAATLAIGLATFAGLFGWQQLVPATARTAANGLFLALVTVVGVGLGPLAAGVMTDGGRSLRVALLVLAAACTLVAGGLALVVQPLYRRAAA